MTSFRADWTLVRCNECDPEPCEGHGVYAFFDGGVDDGVLRTAANPSELTATLIEELRVRDRLHDTEVEGFLAFDGESDFAERSPYVSTTPSDVAWRRGFSNAEQAHLYSVREGEVVRLQAENRTLRSKLFALSGGEQGAK